MTDRFIFTQYRTTCYHCDKEADQIIKAVPYQSQVICDNCGATRIFIPRSEEVTKQGSFTNIGCYDLWNLLPMPPAGTAGPPVPMTFPSDAAISRSRCRNCGFTHFYKFDLEYIGKCPIEENG